MTFCLGEAVRADGVGVVMREILDGNRACLYDVCTSFVKHLYDCRTTFASFLYQLCLIDAAAVALRATVMRMDPLGWRFCPFLGSSEPVCGSLTTGSGCLIFSHHFGWNV